MERPTQVSGAPVRRDRRDIAVAGLLLVLAAAGWWWSAQMASPGFGSGGMDMDMAGGAMSMSLVAFVVAWAAMMAAMMFPAIVPVVRLYQRAAARGRAAPTVVFAGGYLAVWTAVGIPVWWVWRVLSEPLAGGVAWAGRLAGAALLLAAVYQLTPLKEACLRACRSPMGFFLQVRGDLRRPTIALRAGAGHGTWCLGCCWALMTVLVAVGTMNLVWMVALTAIIFAEKAMPHGEVIGRVTSVALGAVGLVLVVSPATLATLT